MSKKFFILVGFLHVPRQVVREVFREKYGYGRFRCFFLDKEHYLKAEFSYANMVGKKIEAIFVGPVPHK